MKKKIIALATAAMCMTGSINTVFASTFADINDVPWPEAAKYIDEAASLGLMAGYTENGKKLCKARNNVTYNEAMQLVYQIMCSYNSANKASASVISKWTSTMKNANIPSWAYECVAYGLENSILSSNDLKIFMSSSTEQRNATREDVGVIFGKALSKVYTVNQSAALKYNDKNAITASSVPYLELLNRLNLMVGDANNNFNPKANINRAEMAVLSTKTYKELKGTGSGGNTGGPVVNEQIVGEVTKISDDSITVKTTAGEKTAKIDSKVYVMYEGDKGEVADINEGDSVIVVVNNGTATFITAYSSGTSSNIKEGTITSISKTRITIENGSKKATYKFDDDYNDVTLKLDGKTSKDIDDLIELVKDGENIEAEITADKNGYVTKITAETVEKKALEGTVTGLTSSKITIKVDGKTYSYYLLDDTDDIEVKLDGKTVDFDDLKDEYDDDETLEVELKLNSKKEVTEIKAETESSSTSASGKLTKLSTKSITIKPSSGSSKTYDIKSGVTVTIDGSSSSISKLKDRFDDDKEYTVKLTLSGGKVTKIAASLEDEDEESSTSGRVESIDEDRIKIKDSNGKYHTYTYSSKGCDFYVDGKIKGMSSVISSYGSGNKNVKAYITLNGADRAEKVKIETNDSSSDTDEDEGTLVSISSKEIKIKLSDGDKVTHKLAKSCKVTIDGKSSSVSKLEDKVDDDEEFEVELTFDDDDKVSKIKASSAKESVSGNLLSIDEDKVKIGEKLSGGSYTGKVYYLAGSVTVIVDGDEMDLDEFIGKAPGRDYTVQLSRNSDGKVTKIVAKEK
ncbi:MAG: S-layer homology domain-containing protein [Clostridiales bacterium]|nr:S-layer homology domain-containing protein [Clostridiales bacterium]